MGNDDVAIGRLAAEHLLEYGLQHFAFSGYRDQLWADRRRSGFRQAITGNGGTCDDYWYDFPMTGKAASPETEVAAWKREQRRLTNWIKELPGSVGLMACNDPHAQQILDACQRGGLGVPEQFAVIGVDNDEELCRLTRPPISSLQTNARKIGFEAARALDRFLSAETGPVRESIRLIDPVGVIARQSTDVTAIDDAEVAKALAYIRDHAFDRELSVDEVVRNSGMSRRSLFTRFQSKLGRTPRKEIQRLRLRRAKVFLRDTKLTLEQIASRVGYSGAAYFCVAFRPETGISPGQHRNEGSLQIEILPVNKEIRDIFCDCS